MTLLISDDDVDQIFTSSVANNTMLDCFRSIGKGDALAIPRLQIDTTVGWLRIQAGSVPSRDFIGFKAFSATKGFGPRYVVFLYRISTGQLCAIVNADTLTVRRTGALSGVATQFLAKKDSRTLGVLGSSRQARSLIESVSLVRKLDEVRVCSPNKSHRESFAQALSSDIGTRVTAVDSPKEAVAEMDIVGTATGNKTMSPILFGEWLKRGTHVNAIGAVGMGRVELDSVCFARASLVVVDSREECIQSSQEIAKALESHAFELDSLIELSKMIVGDAPTRSSDKEITIFKSQGSGVQDIFAASIVYEIAVRENRGREIGEVGPALRQKSNNP